MAQTAEYLLGTSDAERARLIAQCELHRPEAEQLFDRIGIEPGWRAIDIGCGPLGVLDLLSERVGPSGSVVGLEREPRMLDMAALSLVERHLDTVRLVQGDAAGTQLPAESFDLVHERLVLFNVSSPEDVVAEMVRLARPGGYVALQDLDIVSYTCEPPHPAWDRLVGVLISGWRDAGLDPSIGRRLPGLLRAAGLGDVEVAAHARVLRPGDLYHTLPLYLAGILREQILASDALTEAELDDLVRQLAAHLEQPETLVLYSTLFQAWGRKPLGGSG
ncbi:MAG: methyltransferase domain-containing protein [Egibacteraceae bacterium]